MEWDVLVIGGGVAGLSAAINVRARGGSVLVVTHPLEENPLARAERVDNYPGLPGVSGRALLEALWAQAESSGASFRIGRALSALPMGEDGWMVSVEADVAGASAVILAAGVVRGKKYPGEAELLGRGVSYCATCDGMLYRGRDVVVLGWTESARREADFLRRIGCRVTYLEDPAPCSINGSERVESLTCGGVTYPAEGVFVLRSAVAPTDIFPGLAVADGAVAVDRSMATNLPGVFAAGDCTGAPHQAAKAAGEGLVAGQQAMAWLREKQRHE